MAGALVAVLVARNGTLQPQYGVSLGDVQSGLAQLVVGPRPEFPFVAPLSRGSKGRSGSASHPVYGELRVMHGKLELDGGLRTPVAYVEALDKAVAAIILLQSPGCEHAVIARQWGRPNKSHTLIMSLSEFVKKLGQMAVGGEPAFFTDKTLNVASGVRIAVLPDQPGAVPPDWLQIGDQVSEVVNPYPDAYRREIAAAMASGPSDSAAAVSDAFAASAVASPAVAIVKTANAATGTAPTQGKAAPAGTAAARTPAARTPAARTTTASTTATATPATAAAAAATPAAATPSAATPAAATLSAGTTATAAPAAGTPSAATSSAAAGTTATATPAARTTATAALPLHQTASGTAPTVTVDGAINQSNAALNSAPAGQRADQRADRPITSSTPKRKAPAATCGGNDEPPAKRVRWGVDDDAEEVFRGARGIVFYAGLAELCLTDAQLTGLMRAEGLVGIVSRVGQARIQLAATAMWQGVSAEEIGRLLGLCGVLREMET